VASRKRRFGELSKRARDRAARAGREHGLTRRQVRERYNRGTYSPFARTPEKRVPREFRRYTDDTGKVDWREAALDKMRTTFSDYYQYSDDSVVYYAENMPIEAARLIVMSTEAEMLHWGSVGQPDKTTGEPPPIENWNLPGGITLNDVSVYVNGEWNNVFWYH
jgi:hypothetical protein